MSIKKIYNKAFGCFEDEYLEDHLNNLSLECLNIKNKRLKEEFEYFFKQKELDIFVFRKIVNIINNFSLEKPQVFNKEIICKRNIRLSSFKSDTCKFISNLIPRRLIFWILIKAFSEVNMKSTSRDKITYNTVIEYYGERI